MAAMGSARSMGFTRCSLKPASWLLTSILIHAVAAHRDARHTVDRANVAPELVTIAVGQTKIALDQTID
jgi:hypothetical protein